jgi:hypothetical protein
MKMIMGHHRSFCKRSRKNRILVIASEPVLSKVEGAKQSKTVRFLRLLGLKAWVPARRGPSQ